MKFYWGITGRGDYTFIPPTEHVIVSAMSLWRRGAKPKRMAPWSHWALDSGGFVAFRKRGDYPFGPDDYLKMVEVWKPTWAASLDYPCEPELCAANSRTVSANIAATVEMAHYLCKRDERIVPVIQGYRVEEYEDCWRQLPKTGRVAIGSICRRASLREIIPLAHALKELLVPVEWRHGFGVKLTALRHPVMRSLFTSVDSNAWEYVLKSQWAKLRHLRFQERMEWAFYRYQGMLTRAMSVERQGLLL